MKEAIIRNHFNIELASIAIDNLIFTLETRFLIHPGILEWTLQLFNVVKMWSVVTNARNHDV